MRRYEHFTDAIGLDMVAPSPPLSKRRCKLKFNMIYKIKSNLVHIPKVDLTPNRRKPFNCLIPSSSVDPHLFSFFPSSICLWNSIPHDLKTKPSLYSFKVSLDTITVHSTYGTRNVLKTKESNF